MLKSLSVRNVVLIDALDVEFQSGFSVLSGETGAGKSILLDALGLLLGRRADAKMIRQGCDKLAVVGVFELKTIPLELRRICSEYDLDCESEIVVKRTLDKDGKSKIFFNGEPITLKFLKEIGAFLAEIHGQFDNQGLLNPANHRDILDCYGNYKTELSLAKETYAAYTEAQTKYSQAEKDFLMARQEEENLRHWVDEFVKIQPKENELTDLEDKRRQLMNAEKIVENLSVAEKALNGTAFTVASGLRQAQAAVAKVNAVLNDKYTALYEVLDTALINVIEAEEEIGDALNDVSLSQNDIDSIEERLFKLKSLARKHQVTVDELPDLWQKMADKLVHLERGGEELQKLYAAQNKARQNYLEAAQKVSAARKATALELDAKIMAELPDLKMAKAKFVTQIQPKTENEWSENGIDDICFMAATNLGQPLAQLSKIASGGELARFMLAIKVNLAQSSQIETMVFDEVDTGVGGATAQAVGEKLAKLGEQVQVLVVTHSPQVAALSEHHYKVEKYADGNITTTKLRFLDEAEKQEEIARMLSGEQISNEARAAAKVLIGA